MATLTIAIDPEILEAAKLEAERRHTSLGQMVSDPLATITPRQRTDENSRRLIELINQGPLGHIDRPLTREEIYAERTWPRS